VMPGDEPAGPEQAVMNKVAAQTNNKKL
jgi:hypothetical protein